MEAVTDVNWQPGVLTTPASSRIRRTFGGAGMAVVVAARGSVYR